MENSFWKGLWTCRKEDVVNGRELFCQLDFMTTVVSESLSVEDLRNITERGKLKYWGG